MEQDPGRWLNLFAKRVIMSWIGFTMMAVTWAATFSTQTLLYLLLWPFMTEKDLLLLLGWVFRKYTSRHCVSRQLSSGRWLIA
jgi:hypothetical protein